MGSSTDVSGLVTSLVAVLAWFLTLALADLGWATALWLSWAINNDAVISALWFDGWTACLTYALGTSTTFLRACDVVGKLNYLVHALARWEVGWEGSLTFVSSSKLYVITSISAWDAAPDITALVTGDKLFAIAWIADLLWCALRSKVIAEEGTVLVTLAWLAAVVILVPSLTILLIVLRFICTLRFWTITVPGLAVTYIKSRLDLAAVTANWVDCIWTCVFADALLLRAALFNIQVLDLTKLETSATCWREWQILGVVHGTVDVLAWAVDALWMSGVWWALTLVGWTAVIFIRVADKGMLFPIFTVTFLDGITAVVSSVNISDDVVTVASVDTALVTVIPTFILDLSFSLSSNWVNPLALSADALDELLTSWFTWAVWFILVDWALILVLALGWFLTFGWVTDASVSAASCTLLTDFGIL